MTILKIIAAIFAGIVLVYGGILITTIMTFFLEAWKENRNNSTN